MTAAYVKVRAQRQPKMRQIPVLLLAVLCVTLWSTVTSDQSPPAACRDSSECSLNQCCLLGRYQGSEPACHVAPGENDICRPGQLPTNATIDGMDGMPKYTVTNVYIDVCPCGQHLSCDPKSGGVCKKST